MCRIAAYIGPELPLEKLIVDPDHSLLRQSLHAEEAKLAVNGDGFGMAWYHPDITEPGLYRDVLPAWADANLLHLCRLIRSGLFLSHIRASTVGETSRSNCHPFTFRQWSFCHNGQIPHIARIRRKLESALPDEIYQLRRGTTDSELFFLTMLANGLDMDVPEALAKTISDLGPPGKEGPVRVTAAFSDGQSLYAVRHASDGKCPSLYSANLGNGVVLASEPLQTAEAGEWTAIEPDCLVQISREQIIYRPLGHLDAAA